MYFHFKLMAVFTLEDDQIVWTDKSSQTNESSDVLTRWTNFSMNKYLIFRRLERQFFQKDSSQVEDSTTQFKTGRQMPDDLSI